MRPRLCDTPVPYYDNGVPCGNPADSLRKADGVYLRPLFEWTPERAPKVRVSILDKRLSMARALRKMLA